ncbi:Flp family type IVb pilin [Gilliamella sp. App4-10]|uniref:Flp family type IVb pilin n=1 Tax=Gilliamella sp. App4-10 TaxID=3120231 RepID=UPI001C40069B|nr:Flp family type IVb pilin [Gilliamella apicola]
MMNLSVINTKVRTFLGKFAKTEEGVTAIEYAIVAAGVAVVVMAVFASGGPVETMLKTIFESLKNKVGAIVGGIGGK